jgi:hypothetical protein
MSTNKNISFLSNAIYAFKVSFFALFLIVGLSWVVYQILENYSSKFYFVQFEGKNNIYILNSQATINQYKKYKVDTNLYIKWLSTLEKKLKESDHSAKQISEQELSQLDANSVLIVFDAISLRKRDIESIKNFTKNGGFLIFNYNFGFNTDLGYEGTKNIEDITSLKKIRKSHEIKDKSLFIVNRLLSPLNLYDNLGKRIDFKSYDTLNLYSSKDIKPDIYLSNWELTKPSKISDKNLKKDEAGVTWHGSFGKGNWVYFSFPTYVFFEANSFEEYFRAVFESILSYATKAVSVKSFPYLDRHKTVLVSEDTEYKFSELDNFMSLAEKSEFPVTAFCVSSLAEKHPELMKKAGENRWVEIASHSYSHEKIIGTDYKNMSSEIKNSKKTLESLSKKDVIGFRPPREELNSEMLKIISNARYHYVLESVSDNIYPLFEDNIYHIARLGTDDYHFMLSQTWDADAILDDIKQETEFVTSLDGIYNFDIHTHLLGYGKNLDLLKSYISYINSDKNLNPLNAKEIVERLDKVKNIEIHIETTAKNYLVTIKNLNDESTYNYHFRLYWPHAKSIKSINSEIIGSSVSFSSNKARHYSDVSVEILAPHSPMTLIVNYEAY